MRFDSSYCLPAINRASVDYSYRLSNWGWRRRVFDLLHDSPFLGFATKSVCFSALLLLRRISGRVLWQLLWPSDKVLAL
ncbi:hypothetical protein TIFTF001_028765 [Ficus carica]|uniref:Uncharacterized protein n=1 Tax=Ficus carica TaxID=3494 RepID=A0AA88DQI8_FICCA|nr:hypothetical protein TIFTF001_028765 [Ficus carica]